MIIIDTKHNKRIVVDYDMNAHIGDEITIEDIHGNIIIDGEVRKVKRTLYVKSTNNPNYLIPYNKDRERIEVTIY